MTMTQTGAKPCPESDPVFNAVYEWVTQKSRKRRSRVITMDWLELTDTIGRERAIPVREVSDKLASLLDLEWIEKTDQGFRVLVPKNPSELAATPGVARTRRDIVGAERLVWRGAGVAPERSNTEKSGVRERSERGGVKQESALSEVPQFNPAPEHPRSRVVVLARETFPRLCLDAGIAVHPMQFSWMRLAGNIKRWLDLYDIDVTFVRQMMVEFTRHPEWSHSSRRSPDVIFLARREKLSDLVLAARQRDPANREFSHNGGTEYWMGKYAGLEAQ